MLKKMTGFIDTSQTVGSGHTAKTKACFAIGHLDFGALGVAVGTAGFKGS